MKFENITVIKKANVYFDGKVTSRTILFPDGQRKTLGFMTPGSHTFSTEAQELMEVLGGSMEIKLPGADGFTTYGEGESFVVPANSSFDVIIPQYADYCCSYQSE